MELGGIYVFPAFRNQGVAEKILVSDVPETAQAFLVTPDRTVRHEIHIEAKILFALGCIYFGGEEASWGQA